MYSQALKTWWYEIRFQWPCLYGHVTHGILLKKIAFKYSSINVSYPCNNSTWSHKFPYIFLSKRKTYLLVFSKYPLCYFPGLVNDVSSSENDVYYYIFFKLSLNFQQKNLAHFIESIF